MAEQGGEWIQMPLLAPVHHGNVRRLRSLTICDKCHLRQDLLLITLILASDSA